MFVLRMGGWKKTGEERLVWLVWHLDLECGVRREFGPWRSLGCRSYNPARDLVLQVCSGGAIGVPCFSNYGNLLQVGVDGFGRENGLNY